MNGSHTGEERKVVPCGENQLFKGPVVGWRRENASERLSSLEYREQGDCGLKSDWILFLEQANPVLQGYIKEFYFYSKITKVL